MEARLWGQSAALGPLSVVGDVRIDHKAELARALDTPVPDPSNDAMLFLLAWQRWGMACLNRIEGDFAVAIWDGATRRLILARDALGSRPLHFRPFPWGMAFGSTAAPLACIHGSPEPDLDRLTYLLAFITDPGERSFLSGVRRVIPGHAVIVAEGEEPRQHRWWNPDLKPRRIGIAEGIEAMRAELDRAVAGALASDSPVVAAQLSGGHDSTLVVETASRLIGSGRELVAITGADAGDAGELPDNVFSDEQVAVQTAAMLPNIRHRIAAAPAESPMAAVDRWIGTDQAMFNPYNLGWLDLTYSQARKVGAEVMLVGASGNLTVSHAGPDRFSILARSGRWITLLREMKAHRRNYAGSWFGLLGVASGPWIPAALWLRIGRMRGWEESRFDERAFLKPEDARVRRAIAFARRHGLPVSAAPPRVLGSLARLREIQWADYGPVNHYVRAVHRIELRDPLGARRVMECSLSLGPEHFYRDGEIRRLSKALLKGRVPDAVLDGGQKKGMQGANWLAGALEALPEMKREVDRMASDPDLASLFDVERIRALLDDWPAQGWSDVHQSNLYRGFLTKAIASGRFARRIRERDCAALLE